MKKSELVNILCQLNDVGSSDNIVDETLDAKISEVFPKLDISDEFLSSEYLGSAGDVLPLQLKYVLLNGHLINLLDKELRKAPDEILSVHQTKLVKGCLRNVMIVGILQNILPTLPHYVKTKQINQNIEQNYYILKHSTLAFCNLLREPNIRSILLPHSLQGVLVALYQLSFCPVKKPVPDSSSAAGFIMTPTFYNEVTADQKLFTTKLRELEQNLHPAIYIKETMSLFHQNAPFWFKKALSATLTRIIKSKNGLQKISTILLDGVDNDSTKTWKIIDIIAKLVVSCRNSSDFETTICGPLVGLLRSPNAQYAVEQIFAGCVRALHEVDSELTRKILMKETYKTFYLLIEKTEKLESPQKLTADLLQSIRLLDSLFLNQSCSSSNLPMGELKPFVKLLFRFYEIENSSLTSMKVDLGNILVHYFKYISNKEFSRLLDNILFRWPVEDILEVRDDYVIMIKNSEIVVEYSEFPVKYFIKSSADALHNLVKSELPLSKRLFNYLLGCLYNSEQYFPADSNTELLTTEDIGTIFEQKITIYQMISTLAEDKSLRKTIIDNPSELLKFVQNVFTTSIKNSIHEKANVESDQFQILFTTSMILQGLLSQSEDVKIFECLIQPLEVLSNGCNDKETRELLKTLLSILRGNREPRQLGRDKTLVDEAIEDCFDESLPTKGHGLIQLTKLVLSKDSSALERKQYILNIFQENVKNKDTYVYLAAIKGLAAMADIFTDTVINVLCDEFSNFPKDDFEDENEVRMKLGEVLVQTTKILGEMAPKYKSLLLNTFLVGTKDDDPLMRASSLSNLGEVCRILGYKLGTIVSEILVCFHAIITTDKAIEARRAAVTVIKQLFIGLGKDVITVLQDDILPIYRSLKLIYTSDSDDVMRLQAQLALEELNESMKEIVFPQPQINTEKKIFVLK